VVLGANVPAQVARGNVQTDQDGPRQATVILPPGLQAALVLPDGSAQTVSSLTLRATEYTVGTPFSLHYASHRVPGRTLAYTLRIPLSGTSIPAVLKRIYLEVHVAGQRFTQSWAPQTNLAYVFTWDGKDA
jgi:hypothetical protein